MGEYENENIIKDIMNNYDKYSNIILYIFSFINFLILTILLFSLNNNNRQGLLKYRLYTFILSDNLLKIIYIKLNDYTDTIRKELLLSLLSLSQFFLIISFAYQIFYITKKVNEKNEFELINKFKISIIYVAVIFSYDKIFKEYNNIIIIVECLIIIYFFSKIYTCFKNAIVELETIIKPDDKMLQIILYLKYLNIFSYILSIVSYIIKIISTFSKNEVYLFYLDMILIIIKNVLKYIVIYVFSVILCKLPKNYFNCNDKNVENKVVIV